MKASQADLTRENDLSKTEETRRVIAAMTEALEANADNMADFFHEDFCWYGNFGCGVKRGLAAFRAGWQMPFRACFTDRVYRDQAHLVQGEWMSCFGFIEATHSGVFMQIPPTGTRVIIRYTDFWHVQSGLIVGNWVTVDFPFLLAQLGRDVFQGQGWEHFTPASTETPTGGGSSGGSGGGDPV